MDIEYDWAINATNDKETIETLKERITKLEGILEEISEVVSLDPDESQAVLFEGAEFKLYLPKYYEYLKEIGK